MVTDIATRSQAFTLVSDAVAAGLVAPWRVYLARGCRYLSLSVADRDEWNAWRTHFGCPDLTVRVYETDGVVRRSSIAEATIGGCRVTVELLEDVDLGDLRTLSSTGAVPGPGGVPGASAIFGGSAVSGGSAISGASANAEAAS
jgi:hypothetical protein